MVRRHGRESMTSAFPVADQAHHFLLDSQEGRSILLIAVQRFYDELRQVNAGVVRVRPFALYRS